MKKAFSVAAFSLLAIVAWSPSINAQSGSQGSRPTEKSVIAFKSSEGDESKTQSGAPETMPAKTQLESNSAASEDASKPGNAQAAHDAQKLYESGISLYAAGKLEDAIGAFKEAARLSPDEPQTHFSLGLAYSQAKSYKDAADSFKKAVKLKPDWPEAIFRLGMMSYVLDRRKESTDAYNKLLKLKSPLANTLYRIIHKDGSPNGVPANAGVSSEPATKPVQVLSVSASTKEASASARPEASAPTSETVRTKPEGRNPTVRVERPVDESAKEASAPTTTSVPAPLNDQTATTIYRVGVGDILDIRLLNSTTPRSTLYTVVDGGLIDFPIAGGPISVGGLTSEEIQSRIAGELKRRAVEGSALVAVGVRQYTSHSVIITGLVTNPGTRFLRREAVPLYVIMAEAQPRNDAARVTIMRTSGEKQTVDLNDSAALVRTGDVINVSAREQEFYYIGGRVSYPGQKPFQSGITLLQAILAAGGTARQNDNNIDLSREGIDGRLTTTRYKLKDIKSGKTQDPRLQPGDRIEVVH
jgi:protein involved in polysaccharide export with SLBB domain